MCSKYYSGYYKGYVRIIKTRWYKIKKKSQEYIKDLDRTIIAKKFKKLFEEMINENIKK